MQDSCISYTCSANIRDKFQKMCTKDNLVLYYVGNMYEVGESLRKQSNWPHILVGRGKHGTLKGANRTYFSWKSQVSQ